MKGLIKTILVIFLLISLNRNSHAQRFWEEIIQITGVTMTADSLRAVPDVTISVKNKERGVISNHAGVFSLVCSKGDTLHFSCIGYRSKEYVVDEHIDGNYFSLIQLMVQDTFYLPETIIRPNLPTAEEFEYAFRHWNIPDDPYTTARKNTDPATLAMLRANLPKSGPESQSYYQAQQAENAYYYGQQRAVNIMNPMKWNEFFNAWKRGDYRKKR